MLIFKTVSFSVFLKEIDNVDLFNEFETLER